MNLGVAVPVLIVIGVVVLWSMIKERAFGVPTCRECRLDLERDGDVQAGVRGGGETTRYFHCPRCMRRVVAHE
jgi:hypothetical protein